MLNKISDSDSDKYYKIYTFLKKNCIFLSKSAGKCECFL